MPTRRAAHRADGAGRAPRPPTSAGREPCRARPRDARAVGQARTGSAMMRRQARSSTEVTGRRELVISEACACSCSRNPADLALRHEPDARRLCRSPDCRPARRELWRSAPKREGGHGCSCPASTSTEADRRYDLQTTSCAGVVPLMKTMTNRGDADRSPGSADPRAATRPVLPPPHIA